MLDIEKGPAFDNRNFVAFMDIFDHLAGFYSETICVEWTERIKLAKEVNISVLRLVGDDVEAFVKLDRVCTYNLAIDFRSDRPGYFGLANTCHPVNDDNKATFHLK